MVRVSMEFSIILLAVALAAFSWAAVAVAGRKVGSAIAGVSAAVGFATILGLSILRGRQDAQAATLYADALIGGALVFILIKRKFKTKEYAEASNEQKVEIATAFGRRAVWPVMLVLLAILLLEYLV